MNRYTGKVLEKEVSAVLRFIFHASRFTGFLKTLCQGGQRRPFHSQKQPTTARPALAYWCRSQSPIYLVGTAILYSSKGVANTAILNSSSAALGLIPPSRSLSILNHLAIPTRTVS